MPEDASERTAAALRRNQSMATALIVEDERVARDAMRSLLERSGWTVLAADSTTNAFQRSLQHAGPIDLLVMDLGLKDGDGAAMAKQLLQDRPAMACLFISGHQSGHPYIRTLMEESFFSARGVQYLEKPFTLRTLLDTLGRVMKRPK
jgi:CheY-like chemotaxis protein